MKKKKVFQNENTLFLPLARMQLSSCRNVDSTTVLVCTTYLQQQIPFDRNLMSTISQLFNR